MENPAFQNDDPEFEQPPPPPSTTPPTTPPPQEANEVTPVQNGKKPKKRNSVVFVVDDEKVTTITNGEAVIDSPSRKLNPHPILKMHPQLNLSPLIELMGNTISFHLTTKYLACCPTMTLAPLQFITSETESSTPESNSGPGNGHSSPSQASPSPTLSGYEIVCRSHKRLNWLMCCCPSSINSQMISVSRGDTSGEDVLSFIYAPHIWCPASHQERLVDIFMPGMNERMGWIEAGRDIGKGSQINCGLTKEVFLTRQVDEKGCPRSFKIENSAGLEVANGKVTTSALFGSLGPVSRWTGFTFNFIPSELETLPHPTRAVLMAAFLLWVIDAREKRQWQYIWTILFILFLIVCFLLLQFFRPNE